MIIFPLETLLQLVPAWVAPKKRILAYVDKIHSLYVCVFCGMYTSLTFLYALDLPIKGYIIFLSSDQVE